MRKRRTIVRSQPGLGWLVLAAAAMMLSVVYPTAAEEDGEEAYVFVLDDEIRELTTLRSEIELGTGYGSEDSYKFGDYTGLEDKGLFLLGNIDVVQRSRFDAERGVYWRLHGTNLGLSSRTGSLEYGEQGRFGLGVSFDELPRLTTDSAEGFFLGRGGTSLRLPAGWVGASSPQGMTELGSSLGEMGIDHERERLGAELFWIPLEGWEFKTDFRRERKEGARISSALIGVTGGNPRSSLIPEPIDFETSQWNASLRYATQKAQIQLGYYLSLFDNREDSISWENPYTNIGGWNPGVGFGEPGPQEGRKGLAPDNLFHQATLSAGYNLPASTRVMVDVAFGRMKQDDRFLPYTVNPVLSVPTSLPRDSLDGRIDTTYTKLSIVSRPLRRLTLKAGYRYDDRDNHTPEDTYQYVRADAADQGDILSGQARINRPYSFKMNEFTLGAGYRLMARTDLTLDYERETIDRDFSQVETTRENVYTARLRSSPWSFLTAGITALHADRDASNYKHNLPLLESHSPEHLADELAGLSPTATLNDVFEDHPALQKFYLADRIRKKFATFVTLMPMDIVSVTARWQNIRDRYGDSTSYDGEFGDLRGLELGLRSRNANSYTLDVSFTPEDWITTHAFYTYESFKSDQDGWSFRSFARPADLALDSGRDWTSKTRDTVDTLGFGGEVRLLENKLRLDLDYSFSRSKGNVDVVAGPSLPAATDLPTARARLHTLRAGVAYDVGERFILKLNYLFEKLDSSDWALAGLSPDSLSQVISTGDRSADYRANVFWLSVVYKLWL